MIFLIKRIVFENRECFLFQGKKALASPYALLVKMGIQPHG
jgi:hypothetical protein